MISTLFNKNPDESTNKDFGGVVRVIGYRSSGKTTFMAALARWPNASPNSPVQSVIPVGDDSTELADKAVNILEQGEQLEATKLNASLSEVKDYQLQITLKDKFSWRNPAKGVNGGLVDLNISCKDYSGEFFTDLLRHQNNSLLDNYLEDCLLASGIALLIDGTSNGLDGEYQRGIQNFLDKLRELEHDPIQRRIAVILTKAEQPEMWANQGKPAATIASQRFPKVYKSLQGWRGGRVEFFVASAFGTLGSSSSPNAEVITRGVEGTAAVIKKPRSWRPKGLIAPFYWLCTGDRHPDLDKD
jgi:hypothetical protein